MRWETEVIEPKKRVKKIRKKAPEVGDLKDVIKFALFPVKLNNKEHVWWEKYIITYEYKKLRRKEEWRERYIKMDCENYTEFEKWVEKSKRYID
jgi:hypothetical protein